MINQSKLSNFTSMTASLTWKKTLLWVAIFSTAMGYLECTVVVYLREIYYPGGFNFPLAPIDKPIAITEIGREAATLVMLLGIGFLAGKTAVQRFAYFIYSFAIWDIFYYVFLKVLTGKFKDISLVMVVLTILFILKFFI